MPDVRRMHRWHLWHVTAKNVVLLEADELGLGAVWLGIAPLRDRMDKVREVISIPEELEAFAIIPCGYPVQIKNQQNHYEKERVHFVE